MKIAVIGSKGLPPHQGGIEHHCAEIYSRVVTQGHDVRVFARSSYNQLPWNARYFYEGVQVINLPSIPVRGIDALINSLLATIFASLTRSDIIHFHALGPSVFCWIPRLLSPKSKIVMTCHGLDWQRSKWGSFSTRLLKLGERAAVHFAHRIGVVSADLKEYFQSVHNRQTTYIGNAPASYPESDPNFAFGHSMGLVKHRYIVFLGRLVPEKCPDLLISAFKQLSTDWKLVFVGGQSDTITYRRKLLELADSSPDVIFCGELRGKRLAEIVRGAGIFVLPSEVEGLPLALLEAMQENVPVVASDIPVHRQILGGDHRGLLFKGGSVEDCSKALKWAIQNPDAMKHRADRAQLYIHQNHNWDDIADDWLALYGQQLGVPVSVKTPVALAKRS